MGEKAVILRLYKSLLKLSSKFDAVPASKALIYRTSLDSNRKSLAARYYTQWLNTILSGRLMYDPNEMVSIAQTVKNEFRVPVIASKITYKIDAAFAVCRKLNSLWLCHESLVLKVPDSSEASVIQINDLTAEANNSNSNIQAAPRGSFSAFMPTFAQWKDDIKPGTVLMSHPLLQGELSRSLILVVEHSAKGTYGLVLNRPNRSSSLESVVKNLPSSFLDTFKSSLVSYGGPIRRLQYLHNNELCKGAQAVSMCKTDMFAGGNANDAVLSVTSGSKSQSDYAFYAGCCTWSPNQLTGEIAKGFWTPLFTQPDLLVSLCNYTVHEDEKSERLAKSFILGATSPDYTLRGRTGTTGRRRSGRRLEDDVVHEEHASDVAPDASVSSLKPNILDAQLLTAAREAELHRPSGSSVFRVDGYRYALRALGGEHERAFGSLPDDLSTARVEPSDWR